MGISQLDNYSSYWLEERKKCLKDSKQGHQDYSKRLYLPDTNHVFQPLSSDTLQYDTGYSYSHLSLEIASL
jgi:hypothetical protein